MADVIELPKLDVTAPEIKPAAPVKPAADLSRGSAPYAKRIIKLVFQLASGQFSDGGNRLEVTGLRCFVQVVQALTPAASRCQIRVYGLTLDHVNTLTKAGIYFSAANNYVAVQAGDELSGLSTIFNGTIYDAYPDYRSPDAAFVIVANAAAVIQLKPVPPTSFPKSVPIQTALQQIIKPAGLTLEAASGVNAVLASPYFPGTVWQQMNRAIRAGNLLGYHDPVGKKLAVWPRFGARVSGSSLPVVSPRTGMIDYPEFMKARIRVRTLFDPKYQGAQPGIKVQVESQLKAANGFWRIYEVDYNLSAEAPGGPWEMTLTGDAGAENFS